MTRNLSIRAALVFVPALLFMTLSGCAKVSAPGTPAPPAGTNATLVKVVQAETDIAAGVSAALQIVQQFYAGGTISKSDAQTISAVLATITNANAQAISLTKNLSTISATQALTLKTLEAPVVQALQSAVESGLVGIKDANTKAAVTAALSTILTTLEIIQGVTGS
jgi:hypothetical protein